MQRRAFLSAAAASAAGLVVSHVAVAQDAVPQTPAQGNTSNLFDMNQGAAKTVRRPPKRDAQLSMTPDQRDALEREVRCQCGCTLDVYICRTTDFSCQVSPAMHRDIISLVEGGYSAREILDAFVQTYGEQALMAPLKQGFNWAGYLVPFVAIGIGGIALTTVLRGMQRRPAPVAAPLTLPQGVTATDAELAKLQASIRRDE